jgi:aspartyl-tRNA(Asn)/glutamyl-tRNA(Gln) amidotransferase subunit A
VRQTARKQTPSRHGIPDAVGVKQLASESRCTSLVETGPVAPRDCPPGVFLALPPEAPPGIPLAVKDLFDTAGLITTYGSALFSDHVPATTAPAVAALEAAGYGIVGKTNLHEFAYGTTSENPHFGVVPNPLAPGRVAGGSSGGNAAALVLGAADVALGTDSGGSIRIPAACCGIVGFKPTYGLVSLDGCFPLAPSFDHAGPMARDVATCEEAMRVLAPGYEPAQIDALGALSVAVAWLDGADRLVQARVQEAAERFPRRATVPLPEPRGIGRLFMHDVAGVHAELFPENTDLYGEDVRIKIERCLEVSDAESARARERREEYRDQVEKLLSGFDVVLTPTLPTVAPPIGAGGIGDLDVRESLISRTFPFNVLGWPALALPYGPAEDGLPASVQLAGRPGADALVLAAGRLLEAAGGRA